MNRRAAWRRKAIGLLAALATLATGGVVAASTGVEEALAVSTTSYDATLGNATFEAARKKYGLAKEIQHGAILHAWMWSFNTIKDNMKDIAEAGYTSVQTEPMSNIKGPMNGMVFTENWYYVYQPTNTVIGNAVVGTEDDLKAMCAEAHKYGVRVIVDVVANHMTADFSAIQGRWADASLYHEHTNVGDWNNRWQVTHQCLLGLWDIDSNNRSNGEEMQKFLKQAVADGVDGFRFDAAKHIELPGEFSSDSNGSPYWDLILDNGAQYQYGEVLQDGITNEGAYQAEFSKWSSNGGGITASNYGATLRGQLRSSQLNAGTLSNWGVNSPSQAVSWVESHDNYANNDPVPTGTYDLTDYQLTMGWAVIGARKDTAPLFFDRPLNSGGSNAKFSEQSKLGDIGSALYKDPSIAAVNHFRNQMEGDAEYLSNCNGATNCLIIERYNKDGNTANDGIVVANMGGDQSLSGTTVRMDDGTYTDQINGGSITVQNGQITSGSAAGGKVSAFFNFDTSAASIDASPSSGSSFKTDTLDVKITTANVTDASYTTSEGGTGTVGESTTVTIGADSDVNTKITITVTGKSSEGETVTSEFTYTKKDPAETNTIYAQASWSTVYIYMYKGSGTSAVSNAAWPGVAMTKISGTDACGQSGWYYDVPDNLAEGAEVIFTDSEAGTNRSTPDMQPGMTYNGGKVTWSGSGTTFSDVTCKAKDVDVTSVTVSPTTLSMTEGDSESVTATVAPSNATNKTVTWKSSDTSVATVASGTVTAVKAGTATITATAGGKSATVEVTVAAKAPETIEVTGVTVSPTAITLEEGQESEAISAVVAPDNATNKTVAWSVDDSTVIQLPTPIPDPTSVQVLALKAGTATLTATAGGKTATVTVTVTAKAVPVTGISIPTSVTLTPGATSQLEATIVPAGATDRSVLWLSDDPSVATVAVDGTVTAKAAGTVRIAAIASSGQVAFSTVTIGDVVYALHSDSDHMLTSSAEEHQSLLDAGWVDDNVSGAAAFRGSSQEYGLAVHRLYNPNSGLHHFTVNTLEYTTLTGLGWTDEGIAFYAAASPVDAVAVYRGYDPNSGEHLFATSTTAFLGGYTNEGVAWYAVAAQ